MTSDERWVEIVRQSAALQLAMRRMRRAWQLAEDALAETVPQERWELLERAEVEREAANRELAIAIAEIVEQYGKPEEKMQC